MLILSSAELATILTILQICPLYSLRILHNHYKKPCTTALLLINTCLHYSTILMLTPTTNSLRTELGESVIFQPVLRAFHTQHSWIITVHVSLGNLEQHWRTFNRQFLYKKIPIQKPIHILKLPMACSATSPDFYLPPRYETPTLDVNISLNIANLHMINISAQDFYKWQHLGSNRSDMQLQHLTTIPSIPVHKIYQLLLNNTLPIIPFDTESTENTDSIWTLFAHLGIYVSAIGSLIPVGIGLFCCYYFWCQPARLACQPIQPGNT